MDTVETTIFDLAHGGDGVGQMADGRVLFVPGALPGERVRARVTKAKKSFARAELEALLEPSRWRVEPGCPHAEDCGGCQLWHLAPSVQLTARARAALESIQRISGLEQMPAPTLLPSRSHQGWRVRATWHVRRVRGRLLMGFYAPGSHHVVDQSRCPILEPALERARELLREGLPEGFERAEIQVETATQSGQVVLSLREVQIGGHDGGAQLRRAFERLVTDHPEQVRGVRWVRREEVERWGEPVIDAGCALAHVPPSHAAAHARRAVSAGARRAQRPAGLARRRAARGPGRHARARAVRRGGQPVADAGAARPRPGGGPGRGGGPAVEAGQRLVEALGLGERLTLREADLSDPAWWELPEVAGLEAPALVLDPPRQGAREVCQSLAHRRPDIRGLVYVSCAPGRLARDLKELAGQGWRLWRLGMLEMFPHAAHLEVVATLRR